MSGSEMTDIDFRSFTLLWNRQEGRATPDIHVKMADWLEWHWKKKNTRQLLMAFRSSGKSTIVGLFAAWLLYTNPDLRILVLAADYPLARKMVRQVKRIIEKHPFTAHLVPDKVEQWAGNRFTVKRNFALRDPSMLARGITGNITGSRADIVICDDVEVPNTCDTTEKRADLRERLAEIDFVLAPGGMQLFVGTPHTWFSVYAQQPRAEAGEEKVFLEGFKRMEIPLVDQEGISAWPEKFTSYAIAQIKTKSGPNKFASQMMLEPMNIAEGRLNIDLLHIYSDELDYTKELRALFIGQRRMVSASAWWDPSIGSAKGDRSVLAVIFCDAEGDYFLHRVAYLKVPSQVFSPSPQPSPLWGEGPEVDPATSQCRQIAHIAQELYLPSITVESNGIGGFLPRLLRNAMTHAGARCGVKDFANTRPKTLRILEAWDAPLAARRIRVHKSVLETPLLTEMKEWQPYGGGRDDGLDAVAGALAQAPVRLPVLPRSGRGQEWMAGALGYKAETEFEV